MKNIASNYLKKYIVEKKSGRKKYSLLDDAFSKEDLIEGIKVILSKKITMGKITSKFENEFAKFVGAKYALMVNSGSSANLLAVFASCNPLRKNRFKLGDEAIIPAVLWSTSLWPLVQSGLKPKFVDIDPLTLNADIKLILSKITSKTKLIMAIHVLGNSTDILKLRSICKKKNIILIEDTCESLGSKFKNKSLGTFGDFGTYSFYYSHQITSGEGGMVTCNTLSDYKILYSLRAHGWARGISALKNKKEIGRLNKDFIFINSGFNLRPTDIAAAIGRNQLKRLKKLINIRDQNRTKIINQLLRSKSWQNQFTFIKAAPNITPSWFGMPILVSKKYNKKKNKFLKYLNEKGIETRPIISGNFMNQPCVKLYKLNQAKEKFINAQKVDDGGFFIGLHTQKIKKEQLEYLEKNLLNIINL
jgi:CDP-6-deoxy-D-xylo-4-hexulose-3-dehydrase